MTEKLQVYKCHKCGNIVMVMHSGKGELVCCQEPMELLKENSTDAAQEKHVPVIEKLADGYKVQVGSTPHPMEEKHYIEWIELLVGDKSYIQFLHPGEAPEAIFKAEGNGAVARAYCNLHGFWKNS